MSVSSPACCQLSGQLNAHYADPAAAAAKGIFSCGCAQCLAMPYYTPPPAGAGGGNGQLGVSPVIFNMVTQSGTTMDGGQAGFLMTAGSSYRSAWNNVPNGEQLTQVRVTAYGSAADQAFATIRVYHVRQAAAASPVITLLAESFTVNLAVSPGTTATLNIGSPITHAAATDYYMVDFYAAGGNSGNVQVTAVDQTVS